MDIYGYLWISMDINGYLWISMAIWVSEIGKTNLFGFGDATHLRAVQVSQWAEQLEVVEGMDVVRAVAAVPTDWSLRGAWRGMWPRMEKAFRL